MTTSTESLERKIESVVERLVREHLAVMEAAASAAVREGFRRATRSTQSTQSKAQKGERAAQSRSPSVRRPREAVAKLEEQLYKAVCAQPGETMTVLAQAVGSTPSALNRPAALLRLSGRVRSAGQRQFTRYFPMGT